MILWLSAFGWTCLIEVMALVGFKWIGGYHMNLSMTRFILINLCSHLTLWFVFPMFIPYAVFIFTGELWVVLFEGLFLTTEIEGLPRALFLSLCVNSISALLGVLFF